jgi:hypothetical protein
MDITDDIDAITAIGERTGGGFGGTESQRSISSGTADRTVGANEG